MDLLEKFEKLTGEKDDELLELYLQLAEETLLSETRRTVLIRQLEPAKLDLALSMYNHSGMEGEKSRSEGGIAITLSEIPLSVQRAIAKYRLARSGGYAFEKKQD